MAEPSGPTVNQPRFTTADYAMSLGGSVLGAYVGVKSWGAHPIAGGVIGFVLGGWFAHGALSLLRK